MKATFLTLTALATVAGFGVALAQTPPPPGGEGPPPPPPGMRGMMEGMRGPMRHMHPSKAAFFRFRKGDSSVMIKCAEDEPTKVCVDAGSALLDKLAPK